MPAPTRTSGAGAATKWSVSVAKTGPTANAPMFVERKIGVTSWSAPDACPVDDGRDAGPSAIPMRVTVPIETVNKAVAYIRKSANPDGGIRYMAGAGGESRPPITAAAVAVLYNAGKYDDPMAEKALTFAVRHLPVSGSNNGHHYYSHLYLSQALYQRGGKQWEDYYARRAKWLLSVQRKDGSWEGESGTTYGTSIALTILQLPYGYVPIYQR